MVGYLKDALETIIRGSAWMDEPSKNAAVAKIKAMKQFVSHPDWLKNITRLNQRLEQVN